MLILLNSLLLLALISGLWYRMRRSPLIAWFAPTLALRLLAGLALGWLYQSYYGFGDTLMFDARARELAALSLDNYLPEFGRLFLPFSSFEGEERNIFFVRFSSLFYKLGANYWLASAWLSFLSFAACFWLASRLVVRKNIFYWPALLGWLLWPSVVFWGSGLLKDSLSLACLAVSIGVAIPYLLPSARFPARVRWAEILLLILAAWFLWHLKYYVAIVLYAVLASMAWVKLLQRYLKLRSAVLFTLSSGLGVLVLFLISQLHPNLNFTRLPEVIFQQYQQHSASSAPGTFVYYPALTPDLFSLILHLPPAALAGLFAPLKFASGHLLLSLASFENLLLLGLSLWNGYVGYQMKLYRQTQLAVLGACVYVLLLSAALGLSSPNYGSLMRFKIAYLPVYITLLMLPWVYKVKKSGPGDGEPGLGIKRFSRTFAAQK